MQAMKRVPVFISEYFAWRRPLQRLSWRQMAMIGFLFLIMMIVGKHDITSSSPNNRAMHMSSDELADSVESGSTTRQIAFAVFLIGGVLVIVGSRNNDIHSSVLRGNLPLACFVVLAFLSILWSGDASLTFRRSSEYLILCIGAAAAGRILGFRGVVWLAFLGSAGYLLIGLTAELLLGTFRPWGADYRFYGTLYPNEQAWNCVLLLISGSALVSQAHGVRRIPYLMAMTLGCACLFLTKSRTSLVCGALALMFYWVGRLSPKERLALVLAGVQLIGVLSFAMIVGSGAIKQLGRIVLAGREEDTYENFSGRIPLWSLCMEYVSARPLAGYGFNSFWTPEHIRIVSAQEGWAVPESHDGYLEIMLGLGAVGLALYLYQLASTWHIVSRSYRASPNPLVRCYLALLLFYFACMFTETIAFDVGLPTLCIVSLLWSRKLWFRSQPAPNATSTVSPIYLPAAAYQVESKSSGRT